MPTQAAIHSMLAVQRTAITHLAILTAYSESGANEVSGGSYARVASSWNAEANKAFAQNGTVTVTGIPAGSVCRYIAGFSAVTGGSMLELWPIGGSLSDFAVDATTNKLIHPGNTFADGDRVVLVWGTAPGGLTKGVEYFVVSRTAQDYSLAATQGGAAIDITSAHDGETKISKIVPWTADGGPLAITSLGLAGNA